MVYFPPRCVIWLSAVVQRHLTSLNAADGRDSGGMSNKDGRQAVTPISSELSQGNHHGRRRRKGDCVCARRYLSAFPKRYFKFSFGNGVTVKSVSSENRGFRRIWMEKKKLWDLCMAHFMYSGRRTFEWERDISFKENFFFLKKKI